MHLARARDFQPASGQRTARKLNVYLRTGLGEGEKTGAETQNQIVCFKECAAKVGEHNFEVFEAHVFTNPQTFTLVEHG